jgi:cobalt-zinc-cadmium efflux system protein
VTLLLLAVFLAVAAVRRLIQPPTVHGGLVVLTAVVGAGVNLAAAGLIRRADRSRLHVEGVFQHIVTDLYAFLATALAGLIILATGFGRADAIATVIVVAMMVRAGLGLLRDSGRILLEAAPAGLGPDRIGARMAAVTGVAEVHDLHIWQITSGEPALSAHVLVQPDLDCHATRQALEAVLHTEYGIEHTTMQVDHVGAELLNISRFAPEHCAAPHGEVHRPASGPQP